MSVTATGFFVNDVFALTFKDSKPSECPQCGDITVVYLNACYGCHHWMIEHDL